MVFYVKIWTGMASNNTISWSATDDSILTYFRREYGFASQIHQVHVSTPRWSMSIFLLKSHGGTPQNIHFNVFVILVCFIYGENNIWHVQSWRFTPAVEVVSQTALHHTGSWVWLFPTSLIWVNLCKIGKVRQSRNLLDPFTADNTACWWANW